MLIVPEHFIVEINHSLLIPTIDDGCSGYFQFGHIKDNGVLNISVHFS